MCQSTCACARSPTGARGKLLHNRWGPTAALTKAAQALWGTALQAKVVHCLCSVVDWVPVLQVVAAAGTGVVVAVSAAAVMVMVKVMGCVLASSLAGAQVSDTLLPRRKASALPQSGVTGAAASSLLLVVGERAAVVATGLTAGSARSAAGVLAAGAWPSSAVLQDLLVEEIGQVKGAGKAVGPSHLGDQG